MSFWLAEVLLHLALQISYFVLGTVVFQYE